MRIIDYASFAFLILCVCFSSSPVYGDVAEFDGLDPLLWRQQPHASVSHTVRMSVKMIEWTEDVEYFFDCMEDDTLDSGWQSSAEYKVTGLRPQTKCTFIAKVRGKVSKQKPADDALQAAVVTPRASKFDRIISEEIEIIPIIEHGEKDNRINILVMNRWEAGDKKRPYNRADLRQEFIDDIKHTCRAFTPGDALAEKPFANFSAFFNVYAVWWPNVPAYRKGWEQSDYQELRDRLFLPWRTEGQGWATMMAMLNSDSGGGGAGRNLDRRTGDAMITGNHIGKFLHEFSHTAMGCGDKYIGWGTWGGDHAADETFVSTHWYLREHLPWKAWVSDDMPIPTPYSKKYFEQVGVYEGGIHRLGHIFRSSPYCIMGVSQFMEHLCDTCVQRGAQRVYKWVDVFDATTPIRKNLTLAKPGIAKFSVNRVKGTPDCQAVEWRVNSKVIARDVDEIEVLLGAIDHYEITCSMVDHTELIRHDPPYASTPRASISWHVKNPCPQSQQSPLAVTLNPVNPGCWGQRDGQVAAQVKGGKAPYRYQWTNGDHLSKIAGLDCGTYTVDVVDREFRHAAATCTLERPLRLDVDVQSQWTGRGWQIALAVANAGKNDVVCQWSTGQTGLNLNGVSDGTYQYTLTCNGDSFSDEITVRRPASPLKVTIADVMPSAGENNGEIRLTVTGGNAPYQIKWSDGKDENKTERRFLPPGDYDVTVKDGNRTTIKEKITISNVETFIFERPEFDRSVTGVVRILNPQEGYRYIWYDADHPMHVNRAPRGLYEGTFETADGTKVQATGSVIASYNGKWVTFPPGYKRNRQIKNDYSSWVRLDAYFDGFNAKPKTIKFDTDHSGQPGESLDLSVNTHQDNVNLGKYELGLKANWKGWIRQGRLYLAGEGPDGGCFDLRYTGRYENPAKRLHVGSEFRPEKPGNYYVAAQKISDGAVSFNRIGVAVTEKASSIKASPVRPDAVKSGELLLWLDASDFNADGKIDTALWTSERGILHGWRDKAGDNVFDRIHYWPNAQNGLAVADFKYLWVQSFAKPVQKFQTVIMVYREQEMSKIGSSIWRDTGLCFWDLKKAPADSARIPAKYRQATAYYNGIEVDPYATGAPLDEYCVATFVLPDNNGSFRQADYLWEGSLGEIVVYDSALSEKDRKGVEQYLYQKWISTVSLTK